MHHFHFFFSFLAIAFLPVMTCPVLTVYTGYVVTNYTDDALVALDLRSANNYSLTYPFLFVFPSSGRCVLLYCPS